MNLYVGTSGFCYKEWRGSFYPVEMAEREMLPFYASRFRSVEINSTFYRMPKPSVLQTWASEVPVGFRFVLKVPQRMTHILRLKNVGESLQYLLNTAVVLGERLGPLLFQLPPNLKKDAVRLREVLSLLPRQVRAAFEFRHASWFDDETHQLLRQHNAALCIADAEDDLEVPHLATADWGYLRLRRQDYGAHEVKVWAHWVRQQSWRDAFVFFKHEDAGRGPRLAEQFLKLSGVNAPPSQSRRKASAALPNPRQGRSRPGSSVSGPAAAKGRPTPPRARRNRHPLG